METTAKPRLKGVVVALGVGAFALAYMSTPVSLNVALLGVVFVAFLAISMH